MLFQKKRLTLLLVVTSAIILLPLVAMQFTNEVNWSLMDFVVAGILLFGTVLAIELVLQKVKNRKNRIIISGIIIILLLLLWIELAVGVFDSPMAGN